MFTVRSGVPSGSAAAVPSVSTWGLLPMGVALAVLVAAMIRRQARTQGLTFNKR